MPTTPAVSVVIPAYNAERFLRETLGSVLAQTFTDFEVIVVDDGSQDGTPQILLEYCRLDERIRVHTQSNGGEASARNAGIERSRGEFIAIMDADDVCVPHRLATQVELLRRKPEIGVVGAYVQFIDDKGQVGEIKTFPTGTALISWSLFFFNSFAHPSVMIRRSVLDGTGGYRSSFNGSIDFDLFQRLNPQVRFATIPEVLVHYRRWAGSMTSTAGQRQQDNADRVVQDGVRRILGESISVELAYGLRGLAIGAYPRSATAVTQLRALLVRLYESFIREPWLDAEGRSMVAKDLAVKLWLLAVVAARISPALAVSTAAQATRVRPQSMFEFAAKAISKLQSRCF